MLAGAVLIGSNGLMVRLADTAPTVSAFYRMLFAAAMLGALVAARGDWRPLPRAVWVLALLPAAAFAADLWLWHRSILLVGPGLATLLANAQVFFMALAGVLLFGERIFLSAMAPLGFDRDIGKPAAALFARFWENRATKCGQEWSNVWDDPALPPPVAPEAVRTWSERAGQGVAPARPWGWANRTPREARPARSPAPEPGAATRAVGRPTLRTMSTARDRASGGPFPASADPADPSTAGSPRPVRAAHRQPRPALLRAIFRWRCGAPGCGFPPAQRWPGRRLR